MMGIGSVIVSWSSWADESSTSKIIRLILFNNIVKSLLTEETFVFFYFPRFQIRRKSKAHNARLQEGDEIVTVNGRDCRRLTRDVVMSYVDGAKESLDVEVVRYEL